MYLVQLNLNKKCRVFWNVISGKCFILKYNFHQQIKTFEVEMEMQPVIKNENAVTIML